VSKCQNDNWLTQAEEEFFIEGFSKPPIIPLIVFFVAPFYVLNNHFLSLLISSWENELIKRKNTLDIIIVFLIQH
jgi:hypothetical protein